MRTETWEWVPGANQLWLTVKTSGSGRMPGFEVRRVYDPVAVDGQEIGIEEVSDEESGDEVAPESEGRHEVAQGVSPG